MKISKSWVLYTVLLIALLTSFQNFKSEVKVKATVSSSFTLYPCNDTKTLNYTGFYDQQLWNTNTLLQLGEDNTTSPKSTSWGWFKYNMTEAYRGTINITSAKLYWYLDHIDYGGEGQYIYYETWSIDYTNETWFDHNITWNNQPTLKSSIEEQEKQQIIAEDQFYWWKLKDPGTGSYGCDPLQTAYDNNRTKTYVLKLSPDKNYFMAEWVSTDASSYKPYLRVEYEYEESEGEEDTTPDIPNPYYYTMTFYPTFDVKVYNTLPDSNFEGENVSQIHYDISDGRVSDLLLKFNMSFPNLINGEENTNNILLEDYPFDTLEITFFQYCGFSPDTEEDIDWKPYHLLTGIDRSDEDWNSSLVTWNSKPSYRNDVSLTTYIESDGWFSHDFLTDENFLRKTIKNLTTYTVVHRVDQDKDKYGFSDWRMSEFEDQFKPYIQLKLAIEELTLPVKDYLTFSTAHIWLASQWSITPFIAGHLLCAMIFTVIIVPLYFVTRKLMIITMGTIMLSVSFIIFGWLHLGVFIFILAFTILTNGAKIKRWL